MNSSNNRLTRNIIASYFISISSFLLLACQPAVEQKTAENEPKSIELSAKVLAKKYLILDSHIDTPMRLEKGNEDISKATEKGDFDFPRAVEGGLDAPFMAIYTPAELEQTGGSKALADRLIDLVEASANKAPEKFALAYSVEQMQANFAKGIVSLPMGMENGSPIEGDLANLKHFFNRGIRYITLAHSKTNHISDSSYDDNRPAKGLTDFGKELVVEMNKLGVMVDVSHITDDAFYQVMQISQLPVVATHSSSRHFTPGFERNMSDEMVKLLAQKGGVIQVNFGSTFVSQVSIDNNKLFKAARDEFIAKNNLQRDSEEVKAFKKNYREQKPFRYASLDEVLDHFDHLIKLVGVDHVGIGSDYDGLGDSLPEDLKDVSSYPNLIEGLLQRGYSEIDISKILSGNFIRVWKLHEVYAEKLAKNEQVPQTAQAAKAG